MIVMKKHIAAVVIIIIAAVITFFGIQKYESQQAFSGNNVKIILDAGHGGYVECFKLVVTL
ncbi:MAG: hypothetical protein ACI4C7_06695 [Clostridia bacterium]